VETVVKWTIVTVQGRELYSTVIKSDEVHVPEGSCRPEPFVGRSIVNNMEKARQEIYDSPWWKKRWLERE
jgi:hypothetical protein